MGLFSFTGSFTTQMGISKAKIRRGIYSCLLLESKDLTSCWVVKKRNKKNEKSRLEVSLSFKDKSFTFDEAREFVFGWMNACENLMDFKIGPFKGVGTYKYLNGNYFEIQVAAGRGEEVVSSNAEAETQVPDAKIDPVEIPSVREETQVSAVVEEAQSKSTEVHKPPFDLQCPWTCACGIAHEAAVAYCYSCNKYRYTIRKQQLKTNGTEEK
jgi:hypothetical protein